MPRKAIPGQPLVVSAGDYNAAMNAGQWYEQQQALGRSRGLPVGAVNPCVVRVKNNTGGNLAAGSVVELSGKTLTTLDRQHLWLAGITRAGDDPHCGILVEPVASGDYGWAQVSGVCLATVNIIDVQNTHARVEASSTTLKGDFGGHFELLYPASSTGSQTLPVRIGARQSIVRRAKAYEDIATGASGEVEVYINGSVVGRVTAYNDWDAGDVADNDELRIIYHHDSDRWEILKRGGAASVTHPVVFQDEYAIPSTTTGVGIGTSPNFYTMAYSETLGSRSGNFVDRMDLGSSGDPCFEVLQTGAYRIVFQAAVTFDGGYPLEDTLTTSGPSTGTSHTHTVSVYQGKQTLAGWKSYLDRRVGGSGSWTYIGASLGEHLGVFNYWAGSDPPIVSISHECYLNLTAGWQLRHIIAPTSTICESAHRLKITTAKLLIHYIGAALTADTT